MGFLDSIKKSLQEYELKRIAASRAKSASSRAIVPMQSKPAVASSRPTIQSRPTYQTASNYSSKPIVRNTPAPAPMSRPTIQSRPPITSRPASILQSRPIYQSRPPVAPIKPTKAGVTSMLLEPAKAYFTKQLRTPEQQQGVINRMKYQTRGLPQEIRTPVDTIRSALTNRLFAPMAQVPYYAKQTSDSAKTILPSKTWGEAGQNALRTGVYGLNTVAGLIPGLDDIAYAGYDAGKAKLAGKSVRKAIAGEEYTGLGDVAAKISKNPNIANAGNMAELGGLLLAPGVISRSKIKGMDVIDYKAPYKRGDISAIEKDLDKLLDTGSFMINGSWKEKPAARNTAIEELKYLAKQGDTAAKAKLTTVEKLTGFIDQAKNDKANPKAEPIVKQTKPVTDNLEADIPYETARQAHYWSSFDPERRAKQEIDGYTQTLKSDYDELKTLAKTPELQAKLDEMFSAYRSGYKQRELKRMNADSRTASAMVTGPANFPTARNQKRLNSARAAADEAISYREFMINKIKKTLNPTNYAISSDDPAAVKLLTEKMEKLKTSHATMLRANKIIRGGGDVEAKLVSELGLKPETAKQLMQPDFMGRKGFPDYQLISNNRRIKDAQKRIEELAKSQSQPGGEFAIEGGKILLNKENNRLQVVFDAVPDAEMRSKLKSNGYRWSPSQQAWQRQLTDNAKYNAKRLFGDFEKQEALKPQSTVGGVNPNVAQAPATTPKKTYQESLTKYYKPATNLSKEDAVIQDKFYKNLFDKPDQAIKDYQKQFGNVLNTDNVRELSGDYQASRSLKSAAVHEPASAFTKMMYDQLISQDMPDKRKAVLFTAGGTGAGKSTAIDGLPELSVIKQSSKIVYDTNMNTFDSAVQKIDQALNSDHDIVIAYVHSDPIKAFEQAIGRAKRMGRTVPLPEHIKTHIGAYETIYKLKEMYKDNPRVIFRAIDNTGDKGKQFETSLDNITGVSYNESSLKEDLNGLLNERYQTKAISPEIYQGFSGRTQDNAPGKLGQPSDRGNGAKPQAQYQQKPVATLEQEKPMQSVGQILAERKLPKEVQESQSLVEASVKAIKGGGDAIGPIGAKQPGKYAFNVNIDKLDLKPEEKKQLRETIEKIKPLLEKTRGKTLSNDEVIEAAKTSEILSKVTTRQETEAANAAMLAARQRMNQLDKQITDDLRVGNLDEVTKNLQEFVESIKVVSAEAADRGRKLQSLSITAGDESLRSKLIKELIKVEEDTNKIVAEVAKVDFSDANQVTEVYRKFVKPSASDILTEYRYNNMLSSPRTQIRNTFSNLFQTLVTRPATIAATGDVKGSVKYYGGVVSSIGDATKAFADSFTGKTAIAQQDLKNIPTKKLPKFLTIPSRTLEGMDKFFTTLISGGEVARGTSKKRAEEIAAYSLFRQDLNPKEQGKLLNQIDNITEVIYTAGEKVPLLRWFVPFVRTPMNFAKQWVEYSPAGVATVVGSANKREQLAKAMLGSGVALMGAQAAFSGNTTWAAPTDPKEKELFYASGKKPFSIKVGDQWVSMMYAGPFAFSLALPAAMNYYQNENRTALTDGQMSKIGHITASLAEFLSGQTFMEGLGNFVSLMKGDVDYSTEKNLTYTAGQLIPLQGLVRYVSTIVDPVYRKADGAVEQIQSGIPFLSKSLTPYTDPEGNPSKRETKNLIAPYDISTNKDQFDTKLAGRNQELQENALINKAKKQDSDIERALTGGLDTSKYDKTRVAEMAKKLIEKKDAKERRAEFTKLYQKGVLSKEVVNELKRINDLEKKGITTEYRELLLVPEDLRARRVKSKIDALKKENRREKFVQLYNAGIITPDMVEAMKQIK